MNKVKSVNVIGANVYLYGSIDTESVNQAIWEIEKINTAGHRATLHLKTPGGSVFETQALIEYIRKYHIHVHVTGYALSAGFMIFCAAHSRSMSEEAILMYHQTSTRIQGTLNVIASSLEADKSIEKRQDAYVEQFIPREVLDSYNERNTDWYMYFEDAVNYGIVEPLPTEESELALLEKEVTERKKLIQEKKEEEIKKSIQENATMKESVDADE